MDAANKAVEELQEQLQQAKQAAADEASKAAEVHAVEIQKLAVERTKLEVGSFWSSCRLVGLQCTLAAALVHMFVDANECGSTEKPDSRPCWSLAEFTCEAT